jgi:hypothetical protein
MITNFVSSVVLLAVVQVQARFAFFATDHDVDDSRAGRAAPVRA